MKAAVKRPRDAWATLTPREAQVLDLLVEEAPTGPQLARALGVAHHTVRLHMQHMMDKIGCDSRAQLILWTLRRRSEAEAAAKVAEALTPLEARIAELEMELGAAKVCAATMARCFRHSQRAAPAPRQTGLSRTKTKPTKGGRRK